MALTLLFDLDDTLLFTNLNEFVQAYFRALTKHMASYGVPIAFANILMKSTRKMLENDDPAVTLAEVFYADFFPALKSILPEKMQGTAEIDTSNPDHPVRIAIERFYKDEFPSLQAVTRPNLSVEGLIQEGQKRGYRIAIATNPLFPRIATMQRLAWAGLPQETYLFEIVSTYEDFHFTKPRPAYYAEVLAQMGWPDGPVIMIGNELKDDMEGAQRLGLCTYWATPDGKSLSREEMSVPCMTPTGSGDLSELLAWIDTQSDGSLAPKILETNESILAVLQSTPAACATLTRHLQNTDEWQRQPKPGSWSAGEIFCHLRDIEREVFFPRLHRTLSEIKPALENIPSVDWAAERNYSSQDGSEALREFIQARQETIALLKGIIDQEWSHPAIHPKYGQTTLFFLAKKIALHDQDHVRQLKSALLEAY